MLEGRARGGGGVTYLVDVLVVPCDDELGVVEEVVDDAAVGPCAVFGEECERGVPVEELSMC